METLVMKKGIFACMIGSVLVGDPVGFHEQPSSNFQQQTLITGKISPAEAAEVAWIMNTRDTLKTLIRWGNFSQQVKPGRYKLIVKAKPPYQKVFLCNLVVKENHVLDVGELILQK
jgi:hypothetical protein